MTCAGTETYLPDKTWTFAETRPAEGKKIAVSLGGTWRIENGNLKWRTTRCSIPGVTFPARTAEILQLDDTVLKIKDQEGRIEIHWRVGK